MPKDLLTDIKQWSKLSESELDNKISELIYNSESGFVGAYREVLHNTNIGDDKLRTRIRESFFRQSEKYVDPRVMTIIEDWEGLPNEEVAEKILNMYRDSGMDELDKIYIFIDEMDLRNRIDTIINSLIPKFRSISILRLQGLWKTLSDDELAKEVRRELLGTGWTSTTSHISFMDEIYSNITDGDLKHRIDRVLLTLADILIFTEESNNLSGRAICICAKLHLSGTREILINIINNISDSNDTRYVSFLHWINEALQDCPISEAEAFLVQQLEAAPENLLGLLCSPRISPIETYRHLAVLEAHKALNAINKRLADKYAKKIKLLPL